MTALAGAVVLTLGDAALAQRSDDEKESASSGTFDQRTGEKLQEAIELLNMEDYAGARATIGELRLDRLSPYERSKVEQILFSIEYGLESFDRARSHLEQAIAAGGLNEQEISQLRYQIAQTFMIEERWAEGARALETWFQTAVDPNSAAYYLLAVAYYSMGDLARALPPAERAVALAEQPQESWLQLVLALYIDQERWRDAAPLLERLAAMAPGKKTYWIQLSSVYGQVEDYAEALAAMQLAYEGGLLTEESEYMRLADLLMFNEIPHRGGRVLEKAIADGEVQGDVDAYEKLANCWIAAREYDRAIEPLQRAAGMARTGDLFVRLGEVHLQREDWSEAAEALRRGVRKGGLRDTDNAQFLLGVSLFSMDSLEDARDVFERVEDSEQWGESARSYLQSINARLAEQAEEEEAADAEAQPSGDGPSAEPATDDPSPDDLLPEDPAPEPAPSP